MSALFVLPRYTEEGSDLTFRDSPQGSTFFVEGTLVH
jgi:hypothetical protein